MKSPQAPLLPAGSALPSRSVCPSDLAGPPGPHRAATRGVVHPAGAGTARVAAEARIAVGPLLAVDSSIAIPGERIPKLVNVSVVIAKSPKPSVDLRAPRPTHTAVGAGPEVPTRATACPRRLPVGRYIEHRPGVDGHVPADDDRRRVRAVDGDGTDGDVQIAVDHELGNAVLDAGGE